MKKSVITFVSIAIVAIGISALILAKDSSKSLFKVNVEALADSNPISFGPMCSKTGVSGTYYMKRCGKCNLGFGHYAMDVVAFCPSD